MQPTITVDTRVLNTVLRQYAKLNRRDWADICNDKALDVAFRALRETPKADVSHIQALPEKEWWPKYVAKRIMGKSGVSFTRKLKGVKQKFNIQGSFTRAEAMRASAMIIANRIRATRFLKSGWIWSIQRLWPFRKSARKKSTEGAKLYGVPKGGATAAMAGDSPYALVWNSTEGIDKHGVAALERAIAGNVADMRVYIARKLEESARRVAR